MTLRTRNTSNNTDDSQSRLRLLGQFEPREVIFDPDDDRVVVNNPTEEPYNRICAIDAYSSHANGPTKLGSGWIIAPKVIVTAAHVIYDRSSISDGGFGDVHTGSPDEIIVTPALNGMNAPFGQYRTHESMVHNVFKETGSIDFDVGVIILEEPVDSSLQPFAFETRADNELVAREAVVVGYPTDIQEGQVMVEARAQIIDVEAQRIFHQIDTEHGQSGAPLWVEDHPGQTIVVGLQSRGFSVRPPDIGLVNTATRLNQILVDWLQKFI